MEVDVLIDQWFWDRGITQNGKPMAQAIKTLEETTELLDALNKNRARLIDYECITENGIPGAQRLIAFGKYAGIAGMINTFRGKL